MSATNNQVKEDYQQTANSEYMYYMHYRLVNKWVWVFSVLLFLWNG